jgi:hypothetical protein
MAPDEIKSEKYHSRAGDRLLNDFYISHYIVTIRFRKHTLFPYLSPTAHGGPQESLRNEKSRGPSAFFDPDIYLTTS